MFKKKKIFFLYYGNGVFLNDSPNNFANRLFYKKGMRKKSANCIEEIPICFYNFSKKEEH